MEETPAVTTATAKKTFENFIKCPGFLKKIAIDQH
jgi:hypothetical protein